MNQWLPVMRLARKSLLALGGVVLVCLVVVWGLNALMNSLQSSVTQMRGALQQQQAQLELKKADLQNLQAHIQRYKELQSQGFVGEPDRASWVEELQTSYRRLGLPENGLTLQLAAAKPLSASAAAAMGSAAQSPGASAEAQVHDLRLEMKDTLEPEVLGLIADYRQTVRGRFRVDQCKFVNPEATGLSAQCVLRFVSVPLPSNATP